MIFFYLTITKLALTLNAICQFRWSIRYLNCMTNNCQLRQNSEHGILHILLKLQILPKQNTAQASLCMSVRPQWTTWTNGTSNRIDNLQNRLEPQTAQFAKKIIFNNKLQNLQKKMIHDEILQRRDKNASNFK